MQYLAGSLVLVFIGIRMLIALVLACLRRGCPHALLGGQLHAGLHGYSPGFFFTAGI